jgi:hypothetical protein
MHTCANRHLEEWVHVNRTYSLYSVGVARAGLAAQAVQYRHLVLVKTKLLNTTPTYYEDE